MLGVFIFVFWLGMISKEVVLVLFISKETVATAAKLYSSFILIYTYIHAELHNYNLTVARTLCWEKGFLRYNLFISKS